MDIIGPPCNHTSHMSDIYLMETKESRCEECGGEISGTAFTCDSCKVWKHISCADKLNRDLPLEIIHPLHLQHRLQLQPDNFEDFICDQCLYISTGHRYECSSCDFRLDPTCASSVSGQLPKDQEPLRFKDGKRKRIFHYSHGDELGFFKYRKLREEDYDCIWCEKHLLLSEVCHGCTGYCKFYLHQVRSDKIPRTLSHSFHPNHPLRLSCTYEYTYCNVCFNSSHSFTPFYVCEMCSFRLDFDCAKRSPSLKLDCHHYLLTFVKDFNKIGMEGQDSYCKACGKHCVGANVYRCVQCHFSVHLKCVVPSSATHKYHRHPLTMIELIKEDDSEKYYCDVCENERNPKDPVYYCQSCTFIAHIQCVLDQDSFIEDDSGKYYCDFCEEERNPNDDIYYCEECNGQTIAHIECMLAEVEDNTEIRKNIHEERFRKELENVVARFMKFLSNECRPPIEEVIQAGVVPSFVELLGSPSDYVREHAVLALGNIAAVSFRCRDLVLGHGALLPLLALLNEPVSRSMLRNATWTLSRFCQPPFDQVKLVLPTLARLIHSKDEVVLAKVCRALSYLSDGTNDKIQAVIEAGVLGRLVELLMHPSPSVITSALYTVRNIVSGDNVQIQAVIEADIIAPLVYLLQNAEFDIKKQAVCAISNATSGGTHDQIRFLVSQGCIKPLCDLLNCPDPKVVAVCLKGLENMLKVGEVDKNMGTTSGVNLYAQMIDDAKGREKTGNLRSHDNTNIYKKAVEVVETYCDYVREQVVLALGNIAAGSLRCRDLVLGHGALLPLLALLNEPVSRSMLRNATWTLSRFCKPEKCYMDTVKLVLPTLAHLIHSKDEVILAKACRALSYLSDGTNDKIQAVIEAGVLGRLVELLMHPSPLVITPALYTVRNIVSGDNVQTQCVISHQALPCLLKLLTNNYEKSIKVVACSTISNITARNEELIQAIIEANIIAPLVHLLQNAEFDIKKQALKAISNATSGGTHNQIRFLVSQGCIKPLCDLFYYNYIKDVTICLQGLENVLKVEEADKNMGITGGVNLYAQMIHATEFSKNIKYLPCFNNTETYEKGAKVLKLLKQSSILQGFEDRDLGFGFMILDSRFGILGLRVVLRANLKLYKLIIRLPNESTPSEIINNPRFYSYFKDCIGALDVIYDHASVSLNIQGRFRSRKGRMTQNVLVVITFDLRFSYVLAGWEGSVHDSRILSDALSRPRGLRISKGKYYLADTRYDIRNRYINLYHGV
ncbi:hypothetical protein J1N35_023532 [Gossypium stocksii]|uniref:PHD-type domain-containing protein n=1 Tax=Gossypium stocksii TaxID=47602 RepID=A0A9D3VIY9_9ROSI|nr:hypothetical protein J1N35_023532 [Gossypium stocksii]